MNSLNLEKILTQSIPISVLVSTMLFFSISPPNIAKAFNNNNREVRTYFHEVSPLNGLNQQKQPEGYSIEIFEIIAKKLGIKPKYKILPWARGLISILDEEKDSFLLSGTWTQERENVGYKYPKLHIGVLTWQAYQLKNLTKDEKRIIGLVNRYAYPKELLKMFKDIKSYDFIPNNHNLFHMLELKRINTVILDIFTAQKLSSEHPEINLEPISQQYDSPLHIICGKNTSQETIEQINKEIGKLYQNGTIRKKSKKYQMKYIPILPKQGRWGNN